MRPKKKNTVTDIQSQMYYVTSGDINRTSAISSLFETGYQLNQYQVPQYMHHKIRLCNEKLKRNRNCTAQTMM